MLYLGIDRPGKQLTACLVHRNGINCTIHAIPPYAEPRISPMVHSVVARIIF